MAPLETAPTLSQNLIEKQENFGNLGAYYGDELIITPVSRWTQAQRLELLMRHPIFTGLCPNCRHQFSKELLPQVHWDCPACAWRDDSL